MDYSKLDLFSMAHTRMKYLAQAQDTLAHNIVNADNPNFTPKELKEPDFSRELNHASQSQSLKLKLATTDGAHISATQTGGARASAGKSDEFKGKKEKEPFEIKPTHNAISVEEQMVKVNDVAMHYQETVNLMSKVSSMVKAALGNRSA